MATRVASAIFVGRHQELDRAAAALARALEGRPALILIAGEAGVGKTRFVQEIASAARLEGWRVLEGGCVQLGSEGLPFGPFVEAFRGLAQSLSEPELGALLGSGRAELARLVPSFLDEGDDPRAATLPDGAAQGRFFEHLLLLLERLTQNEPLLLVAEDVHWADRSTLELLGFLARNLRRGPIAIAATYRSDELHRRHPLLPFLAEQERAGRAERIELRRFDRREVAEQLESILGVEPEPSLVSRILSRSEGNAFYTEELLASETSADALPETLRDVLLARMASLSDATQELIRVAAAGGSRVSPAVLATVIGGEETGLDGTLREAIARHVLVPLDGSREERYAFRHALVQEAVYAELLPGERTRLHAAFARALSSDPGTSTDAPRAAELAYHWEAAHDLPRAFDASIVAGFAAESVYANAEACANYDRALELWDQIPDAATRSPLDHIDLLLRPALLSEGLSPSRSVAYVRSAIRLVDPATDPVRAGLLHERLAQYSYNALEIAAAVAAHEEAVRLVPAEPPSAARAIAVAGLGRILSATDRCAEGLPFSQEALAMALAVGSPEAEILARIPLGWDLLILGDVEAGLAVLRRAREIGSELGTVYDVGREMAWEVRALLEAGRDEDAAAVAREGETYAVSHGYGERWGVAAIGWGAEALIYLGRWDDAFEALRRAQRYELAGFSGLMAEQQFLLLYALRGRFEEAARQIGRGQRLGGQDAPTLRGLFNRGGFWGIAELALWRGDPDAARAVIQTALRPLVPEDASVRFVGLACAIGLRAEAYIAASARARRAERDIGEARSTAADLLARMVALSSQVATHRPYYTPMATMWLSLCQAEMTRLEGRSDPDAWATAAVAFRKSPYFRAYALMREGEAALVTPRDLPRAAAVLEESQAIAARLGAEPLRRGVDALRSIAQPAARRVDPGRAESVGRARFDLSTREIEVLKLVAAGRSDGEIADALFISKKTASVHVANIKGKLGAASRVEIAINAIGLGLVDAPASGTA